MNGKKIAKIYKYTAIFEPAEEGGYIVSVPTLPGCVTQGETFEDAVVMARDAIDGYIEVLKDNDEEIPVEKDGLVITEIFVENKDKKLAYVK